MFGGILYPEDEVAGAWLWGPSRRSAVNP